jgi:hypothetical protein
MYGPATILVLITVLATLAGAREPFKSKLVGRYFHTLFNPIRE